MSLANVFSYLVLIAGFYMSWNIGANDVSNAMGTSVGSKSLTLKKAVILAAILEFSGAFFVGGTVSETLQQGIIQLESFRNDPTTLVLGMFSALIATSLWLQIASYFGWPVSTTHAIVGAILGFGWMIGGTDAVAWKEVSSIVMSWVLSPALSGILSFIAFSFLQKKILYSFNPVLATKKILPYLFAFVIFVFFTATAFDGLSNIQVKISFPTLLLGSCSFASLAFFISRYFVRRYKPITSIQPSLTNQIPLQQISITKALKHLNKLKLTLDEESLSKIENSINHLENLRDHLSSKQTEHNISEDFTTVEKMFAYLQILSACFVAFAHGANDVANAIGPVASVLEIINNPFDFVTKAQIPTWLLALGGLGIIIGLATWGWRVIETIGKKITELTPTRGFCAEFGAAVTILVASKLGFPISTTHCIVGSVLGVGLAKGIMAINLRVLKEIVLSWVITIPCSATACIILYQIIKLLIGSHSLF
jgi:phosphate/sulfate permease